MRPEAIAATEIRTAPSDHARSTLDCAPGRSTDRRWLAEVRTTILDRPLLEAEWDLVRAFVRRSRHEDLRLRFGSPRNFQDEAILRRTFDIKAGNGEVVLLFDEAAAIAAIAHRIVVSRTEAEIALIVRSDLKRRGIGEYLLRQALVRSAEQGLRTLTGMVLWENRAARRLAAKIGFAPRQACAWSLELAFELGRTPR